MILRNAARTLPTFLAALLISACTAVAGPSSSPLPSSLPSNLIGNWKITAAKVNNTGIAAYLPDDPALLDIRLLVTGDSLAMDGHTCESPRISTEPAQFSELITRTYEASPADMGVISADSAHPTHFITCGKGDIGPSYERGSWIAEIESDTIAMNWFDGVLLFLKRTK
jgi:hypothetical protein